MGSVQIGTQEYREQNFGPDENSGFYVPELVYNFKSDGGKTSFALNEILSQKVSLNHGYPWQGPKTDTATWVYTDHEIKKTRLISREEHNRLTGSPK